MFDIQRFGTNDTVTSSCEGKLKVNFYDGDDRTITFDNPREDLTATDINTVVNSWKTTQPFVGDKSNSASLVSAESFHIITKTKTQLDIS